MLNNIIRHQRIFLRLEQIAIIVCTTEIKRLYFNKRGSHEVKEINLQKLLDQEPELNKLFNNKDIKTFGNLLLNKLNSKHVEHVIVLENKTENDLYILYGITKRPLSYIQKIQGKLFLQALNALIKQYNIQHHELNLACTKIGELVLENVELSTLFVEINNLIKTITGSKNAGLFLYDEKNQYLILQTPFFGVRKEKDTVCYGFTLNENNIVVNVFKNHKCFINNKASKEAIAVNIGCLTNFLNINNIMLVPLMFGNSCIGVYCLINRPDGFNKEIKITIYQIMKQITFLILIAQRLKKMQKNEAEIKFLYQQEKEKSAKYKYMMESHQSLTGILMREPGINVIINRIAQHFKIPIVFLDFYRWRCIVSEIGQEKLDSFSVDFYWNYIKKISKKRSLTNTNIFRETLLLRNTEERVIIAPIKDKENIMGCLILFENSRNLTELQLLALEKITINMCTLELLKQKVAFEVEQSLKNDFFKALIEWNNYNEEDIVSMASKLGFNLMPPYIVLIISYIKFFEEQFLFQEKMRILQVLNNVIKKYDGIIYSKGEEIIVLIKYKNYFLNEKINNVSQFISSKLQSSILDIIGISSSIGIGSLARELKEIKKSYLEARYALNFLKNNNKQGIMYFQDMGFSQLFANEDERKRLEEIAKNKLKELIESDYAKGTFFLQTLDKYFYHDGNLRATAADLHVHINTLRYRLKLLKDNYNIDLTSEQCRFDTHFAIKVFKFIYPELFQKRNEEP